MLATTCRWLIWLHIVLVFLCIVYSLSILASSIALMEGVTGWAFFFRVHRFHCITYPIIFISSSVGGPWNASTLQQSISTVLGQCYSKYEGNRQQPFFFKSRDIQDRNEWNTIRIQLQSETDKACSELECVCELEAGSHPTSLLVDYSAIYKCQAEMLHILLVVDFCVKISQLLNIFWTWPF